MIGIFFHVLFGMDFDDHVSLVCENMCTLLCFSCPFTSQLIKMRELCYDTSLQEAQKRMKIKKPPHILVIHLKRFKYMEQLGRYKKLSYRVVFPLELKLSNTVEDADIEYSLFAVVVHVGSGPNHGHYVSLVKSHNHWLFFDDENVEMIDESAVQTFFGSAQEYSSNTDHGYILFYESLGLGPSNRN